MTVVRARYRLVEDDARLACACDLHLDGRHHAVSSDAPLAGIAELIGAATTR